MYGLQAWHFLKGVRRISRGGSLTTAIGVVRLGIGVNIDRLRVPLNSVLVILHFEEIVALWRSKNKARSSVAEPKNFY